MGMFPDDPTLQRFFLTHTRAIFAYLLAAYKPTVNELAYWMAHPEEIDKRVKGTEHAHTLTQNAAPQRAGILGSLNEAGKPLRMMPTHAEGRRTWIVREWAKQRKGWIFITSTPDTIDALRPMQSLWLDMLILKLQATAPHPGQPRVWMILDELASLNALPQLHSALTKQRKSDNPIVLGLPRNEPARRSVREESRDHPQPGLYKYRSSNTRAARRKTLERADWKSTAGASTREQTRALVPEPA